MSEYNNGLWHGWNGGECPVHPKSEIEVVFFDGTKSKGTAGSLRWSHLGWSGDIIAFRVVVVHREPREWWVWEDVAGNPCISREQFPTAFKVREVLD